MVQLAGRNFGFAECALRSDRLWQIQSVRRFELGAFRLHLLVCRRHMCHPRGTTHRQEQVHIGLANTITHPVWLTTETPMDRNRAFLFNTRGLICVRRAMILQQLLGFTVSETIKCWFRGGLEF